MKRMFLDSTVISITMLILACSSGSVSSFSDGDKDDANTMDGDGELDTSGAADGDNENPSADGDKLAEDGDAQLPDGDSDYDTVPEDGDANEIEDEVSPDGDLDTDSDNDQIDATSEDDSDVAELNDPGLPGDFTWSTATHYLEISGGLFGTTIPLTIYVPDGTGPYPVVTFMHGFQLGPDDYTRYGQHLASWGFIVVMPQMPGSLLSPATHKELKEYLSKILDWIEEDNANLTGVLSGKADLDLIGVSGHSMGGKISLLVSTEGARPKASFVIDPVDAAGTPLPTNPENYPSVTPELMPQITIPLGLLGETVNATCSGFMCQACAPQEDNFQQYYQHSVSPAIQIEVIGANHMSFLDNPNCGLTCSVCSAGSDNTETTHYLSRKYMTAFYLVELYGEEPYRLYLTGEKMLEDVDSGLVLYEVKNDF